LSQSNKGYLLRTYDRWPRLLLSTSTKGGEVIIDPDSDLFNDLSDEEINELIEQIEAEEYWSYNGHPSLTVQQRNPNFK